jgi:hypothetical protein
MEQLSGAEFKALRGAIQSAYRSRDELRIVVREELDVALNEIAPEGGSLRLTVAALIEWAESRGRLEELLRGFLEDAENPTLKQLCTQLLQDGSNPPISSGSSRTVREPAPTPTPPPMVSSRGVDYRRLRDLLKAGKWQEADQETRKRMCEVAGRTQEGWLRPEDIDHFPCEDLRTIDQLWVHFSDGKFGFSVQAKTYRELGGTREYDEKAWRKFGDRVGWRVGGNWLSYSDLTFNTSAPFAHLPVVDLRGRGVVGRWLWFLLSRGDY